MTDDTNRPGTFPANGPLADEALEHVHGGLLGKSYAGRTLAAGTPGADPGDEDPADATARFLNSLGAAPPPRKHGGGLGTH